MFYFNSVSSLMQCENLDDSKHGSYLQQNQQCVKQANPRTRRSGLPTVTGKPPGTTSAF